MKRYSHAFTIAFVADSDSDNPEQVCTEELLNGLRFRLESLAKNGDEIQEAVDSFGDAPVDRLNS